MLASYRAHVAERAALGIPPLPLNRAQVTGLVELLRSPPEGEGAVLVELLTHRVPAGVDEAAQVKAGFLFELARGESASPLIDRAAATALLGTMVGGYNVAPLVALLDDEAVATVAATALKGTLLMFDAFHDVVVKAKAGNAHAQAVLQSWADGEWFSARPALPEKATVTVFKVTGETNTDDLSPAPDAWSRPDIPLHALAMLKNAREGIVPEEPGVRGPIKMIQALGEKGHPVAYVGDVVGTGSSRKSATNSVLWWTGDDIPHVPNKRFGGFCLGSKIAPIFFNTQEDAGAFPIECDAALTIAAKSSIRCPRPGTTATSSRGQRPSVASPTRRAARRACQAALNEGLNRTARSAASVQPKWTSRWPKSSRVKPPPESQTGPRPNSDSTAPSVSTASPRWRGSTTCTRWVTAQAAAAATVAAQKMKLRPPRGPLRAAAPRRRPPRGPARAARGRG
jgi:hypothetical protein